MNNALPSPRSLLVASLIISTLLSCQDPRPYDDPAREPASADPVQAPDDVSPAEPIQAPDDVQVAEPTQAPDDVLLHPASASASLILHPALTGAIAGALSGALVHIAPGDDLAWRPLVLDQSPLIELADLGISLRLAGRWELSAGQRGWRFRARAFPPDWPRIGDATVIVSASVKGQQGAEAFLKDNASFMTKHWTQRGWKVTRRRWNKATSSRPAHLEVRAREGKERIHVFFISDADRIVMITLETRSRALARSLFPLLGEALLSELSFFAPSERITPRGEVRTIAERGGGWSFRLGGGWQRVPLPGSRGRLILLSSTAEQSTSGLVEVRLLDDRIEHREQLSERGKRLIQSAQRRWPDATIERVERGRMGSSPAIQFTIASAPLPAAPNDLGAPLSINATRVEATLTVTSGGRPVFVRAWFDEQHPDQSRARFERVLRRIQLD